MNEIPYMREELEDTYGILPLQNKILEIMMYIDEFCKEHGIVYYLMGGSALGAMRHGGFIPWDDDIDIFIPHYDYFRFIECCEKHMDKERFYLQREDTAEQPNFNTKIRMNGTTCIEQKGCPASFHQGIFVDIMCLNNAARTKIGKKVQYYAAGMLKAKAQTKKAYKANSFKKKIQLMISKMVVWGPFKKFLLHIVRKNNKAETPEMAHLFGRAKYSNSFYPTSDFGTPRVVPFEKTELNVPANVENYLTARYGEKYMQMPDEQTKAIYESHAAVWCVDKHYTEFL